MVTNYGTGFNVQGTIDPGSTWSPAPDLAEQITSDLFTGGNTTDVNGRTLDAGYGDDGVARTWTASVSATYAITNGSLVRGGTSTSSQLTTPNTVADVEAGYKLTALPAANGQALYFDIRLNLAAGASGARNAYRMTVINRNGVVYVEMYRRRNASTLIGAQATYVVAVGDVVSIRAKDNVIRLLRNNVLLESYQDVTTDFIATGSYVGFESGTAAAFGLTGFFAEKYIGPAV